jgi:prophage DNA circulation protein
MPWNDRIREAAYTSPGGNRLTFDFENVSEAVEKKTTGFDFPDADGTFVQDLGHTGRRYPLRVIFWGDDYDLEAEAFIAALLERGTGKLDHPIYGSKDVVPFGKITRRDDLKTAANQAILEVTFWETIGLLFPAAQTDPGSAVLFAVDEYNAAVSAEFADIISLGNATERATFKNDYSALLDTAQSGLQAIADVQDDVRTQFNAIVDSVNQSIDVLVSEPLTLAFQTTQLIQSPARALAAIGARLTAYGDLATAIISGDGAVVSPGLDSKSSNKFHTNDLYASTYVTGSVVSAVNTQFVTKADALLSAEIILNQLSDVTDWRDDNFESLGEIDTGGSYQQLQEAVALAAGFLVEISFSLKQERSIVLDRSRTIIDLVAELYGSVDDQLDFLIKTNNLSGSEILELPKGREIVYYV